MGQWGSYQLTVVGCQLSGGGGDLRWGISDWRMGPGGMDGNYGAGWSGSSARRRVGRSVGGASVDYKREVVLEWQTSRSR